MFIILLLIPYIILPTVLITLIKEASGISFGYGCCLICLPGITSLMLNIAILEVPDAFLISMFRLL